MYLNFNGASFDNQLQYIINRLPSEMEKINQSKVDAFVQYFKEKYPTQQSRMELEYELGIDEAGRGPVLGSMIYSALWWPKKYKDKFVELGFEDSKELNEKQREKLFELINKLAGLIFHYKVQELTATFLSQQMQKFEPVNLNTLSHNAAVKLIRFALAEGFKITDIYVDTVGTPDYYKQYIRTRIPEYEAIVENITVQPKADRDHKVVSASSICAKVTRDKIIREWIFPQNINFIGSLGSGYPSDPVTKQWLAENKHKVFGYPNLVRFSWKTCSNILDGYCLLKMNEEAEQSKFQGVNFGMKSRNEDLFDMISE